MTNLQMRDWVLNAYSSLSWKKKVEKMSDSQIVAVYRSLVNRGVIKN